MSIEIENEFRTLISKKDYQKLLRKFNSTISLSKYSNMTNYYFDDKKYSLTKNDVVLRIRKYKGGDYQLTLKIPLKEASQEISQLLNPLEVKHINKTGYLSKGEVSAYLHRFTRNKIKIIAELKTRRKEYYFPDYIVVLDHSKYGDKEDYTLEIEAKSIHIAKTIFDEILNKHHIVYNSNTETKSKRAIITKIGLENYNDLFRI